VKCLQILKISVVVDKPRIEVGRLEFLITGLFTKYQYWLCVDGTFNQGNQITILNELVNRCTTGTIDRIRPVSEELKRHLG